MKKEWFVVEFYWLATICHPGHYPCSASPGYMGYPELNISGPMIGATFADWTPALFLIPLKGEFLLFRVIQRCV